MSSDPSSGDDYYSYRPQIELRSHVAVAGLISDDNRAVAYRLTALAGLPFADVDRKVEHHGGMSVAELLWSEGEGRYRELESAVVERELRGRPFAVLALGDGALIDPRSRARLLDQATVVALDLDLPNCFWRLQGGPTAAADPWHPLHSGRLERLDQLRPFYDLRSPGLETAHHHLEMRGKHPTRAAEELLAWLGEQCGPAQPS